MTSLWTTSPSQLSYNILNSAHTQGFRTQFQSRTTFSNPGLAPRWDREMMERCVGGGAVELWSASKETAVRCCSAGGGGDGGGEYLSYLHLRGLQLLVHLQRVVMEPDLHKHLKTKHTLLVLTSNSSNIIKLSKHIQCILFYNITLMFAFLRDEGYFVSSFSLIRFHNTILCVLHVWVYFVWNISLLPSRPGFLENEIFPTWLVK